MPASQAGRRRFDPGLPLQKINSLQEPLFNPYSVYSIATLHSPLGCLQPLFKVGLGVNVDIDAYSMAHLVSPHFGLTPSRS